VTLGGGRRRAKTDSSDGISGEGAREYQGGKGDLQVASVGPEVAGGGGAADQCSGSWCGSAPASPDKGGRVTLGRGGPVGGGGSAGVAGLGWGGAEG
jgi:hypothetical protein